MSAVEKFPILLSEAEEESSAVPPCFSDEGINVCPLDTRVPQFVTEHSLTSAPVPLHPPQQPLPPSHYKTQHQCRRDPALPP